MIDLLQYQDLLKFKTESAKDYLYCLIRKKYLVITPEEIVRQLFIHYLLDLGYALGRIAIEKTIYYHSLSKRIDLMVLDKSGNPNLLIELKAPLVPINDKAIAQLYTYNSVVQSPFIVLSNGQETVVLAWDKEEKSIKKIEAIPYF